MLNRKQPGNGSPEIGIGSPEKPKVNTLLVENFVSLLAAFSPSERQAVFKAIMAEPDFPNEKSPTPPLAGWVASPATTSHAAIVDLCKRIEFCYQEFQQVQRKLPKPPYIDFRATQALAQEIIDFGGLSALHEYVDHVESIFRSEIWWGFCRPERMRQHWQSYVQKVKNQPANH